MKSIGIVVVCMLIFGSGCGIDQNKRYCPKANEWLTDEEMATRDFKIVSWKGHEYVTYISGHVFGLTHNPDCPCKTNKTEVVQ